MKNLSYALLIGIIILGAQNSKAFNYQIQKSDVIYGKLESTSKIKNQSNSLSNCGYFLTKGSSYAAWGPSLTFFVEDSSGKREILYNMLNGTRELDPIETLNIMTATDHKIDKKKTIYSTIYKKNFGPILRDLLPKESAILSLDRKLKFSDRYSTANDTEVLKINYKEVALKNLLFREYERVTNISCSFDKHIAGF